RTLLTVAMVGLALSAALTFWAGTLPFISPLVQGILAMIPTAIMLGGYFIIIYAMMGNVVDYDEMLTGRRREAIYYGTFSFANGLGISVGTLILPQLLERFGYTAQNPLGVRVAFLVIGAAALTGALLFRGYRLGDSPAATRRNLGLPED
ncbi:MAG: MFS transporter, partial [Chloroflexota bacterium]|nr:MFS transporter [Chloroflexota bacterium]